MNRSSRFAAALVLCAAGTAAAAPTKNGPLFRLSSCATCIQDAPAAVANPAGSLLALWEGVSPATNRGLPARMFRPLGTPKGGDFFVRKAETGVTLLDPAIAADPKSFVAVWAQDQAGDTDIFALRYNPTGAPIGAPIAVSLDDAALPKAPEDFAPAVSMAPGGGFVIAWVRFIPFYDSQRPGSTPAIFVRRFAADGKPLAAPLQISTGLVADARPAVCVTTGGAAAVAWTSVDRYEPFQQPLEGVSVRRLLATGVPQTQTLALTKPLSDQVEVAASCGKDGGYIVAWSDERAPARDRADILLQRFAKDGKKAGATTLANATTTGQQDHPAIAHDFTGAFVVAWRDMDPEDNRIVLRRFAATGAPLSGDILVAAGARSSTTPDLAATAPAGTFVVVWTTGTRAVVGQRFKP